MKLKILKYNFDKNDTIENNIKNNFAESSEILEINEVIEFPNSNSKEVLPLLKMIKIE